jgi:putative FmdB family regulatory protein
VPIYEYFCTECEKSFDKIVKLEDKEKAVPCDDCGQLTNEIRIAAASFRIRGRGVHKPTSKLD